jgi:hypothetical protein
MMLARITNYPRRPGGNAALAQNWQQSINNTQLSCPSGASPTATLRIGKQSHREASSKRRHTQVAS